MKTRYLCLWVAAVLCFLLLSPAQASAQAGLTEMNRWLEGKLSAENTSYTAYLFLFVGGLLASLLPCVYPLYPITANIIQARGSQTNRYLHPVVYFAGLAGMYLIFGIIASVSGGTFNAVMRYPLTNLIIGLLIILMGLSTAGLLHLPLFGGNVETRQKGLAGTFVLGMGAGLLASSCVGPVVVSILVGLASSTGDQFSLSTTLVSSFKMLMFGLGLGMPFLLIGGLGISLPKSGAWMRWVQYALSAIIIWFGWTYLEKALSLYNFPPQSIQLIGLGALVFAVSAFFLQSSDTLPEIRMRKTLWALSVTIGMLILVRGMIPATYEQGNENVLAASTATNAPATEQKGELTWYLDQEAAYEMAQQTGKPVFIDFYASWCTNCKEFEKLTQQDETLMSSLKNAVLLKVYYDTDTFRAYEQDSRYPELKVGLPFFVITDQTGNMLYKTNDYLKTEEMALFLE